MENTPTPAESTPNYVQQWFVPETRRQRAQRWVQERVERQRQRLAMLMLLAHGAVNLSIKSEKDPAVQNQLRTKIDNQYGLKSQSWWRRM